MRTSSIRFSGMMSGLDTDSIVQAMTMPYKNKVNASKQDKQMLEWKKDAWKDMNTKIYNFQTKYLNAARLESTFKKTEVTISNPNIIKIDKKSNVPSGTHSIKVDTMASGAMVSAVGIKDKLTEGKKTKLTELGIVSGETIEIKTKDGTKSITVGADTTIADVETAFKDAGVNATFDVGVGAFIVSTKDTGKGQYISLGGTADLSNLGFQQQKNTDATNGYPVGNYVFTGTNAKVTYNGGVAVESATNNMTINGLEFTITGVSTETVTIASTQDKEAVFDFVVEFVNEYNKLIEEINGKVGTESAKGYKPLTEEQKKEMSEDDIKKWEKKITDSILRNDPTLKAITGEMRAVISNGMIVDPKDSTKRISLADMGISTGVNWREQGKLNINEEKLRKAIDENPDNLMKLFTKTKQDPIQLAYEAGDLGVCATEDEKKTAFEALDKDKKKMYQDMGKPGIGTSLYDNLSERLKGTTDKSSNNFFNDKLINKNINDKASEILKLEEQLMRMEDLYFKKFTAMEKALAQLNSQSSALMQQLGGM